MKDKYVKPGSLTWWTGFIPLFAGVFIAAEEIHELDIWVRAINKASGDLSPFALINIGLAIIGLRGAIAQLK